MIFIVTRGNGIILTAIQGLCLQATSFRANTHPVLTWDGRTEMRTRGYIWVIFARGRYRFRQLFAYHLDGSVDIGERADVEAPTFSRPINRWKNSLPESHSHQNGREVYFDEKVSHVQGLIAWRIWIWKMGRPGERTSIYVLPVTSSLSRWYSIKIHLIFAFHPGIVDVMVFCFSQGIGRYADDPFAYPRIFHVSWFWHLEQERIFVADLALRVSSETQISIDHFHQSVNEVLSIMF